MRTDLDNLRTAIAWALDSDRALGFRIANALEMLWIYTNPAEGVRWYGTLLDGGEGVPARTQSACIAGGGGAANPAGYDALAERMYEESHRLYEALGDDHGLAEVTIRLGTSAMYRGDIERARELGTRGLELARAGGYQVAESIGLWAVGEAEWRLGNETYGMQLIAESADLAGEIGFTWQRTRMLRRLADWAVEHGDHRRGEASHRGVPAPLRRAR